VFHFDESSNETELSHRSGSEGALEDTLIKIDIDAQGQRAVGWSDLLGDFICAATGAVRGSVPLATNHLDWRDRHGDNRQVRE
jgi:hypothetical protein